MTDGSLDPRRARGFPAFQARSRSGHRTAESWWGIEWIAAMERSALDVDQLKKGRRYARAGLVGTISVAPGQVTAYTHDGDDMSSYRTTVTLQELSDDGWERLYEGVAARAGHIAALLDGELPHDLVDWAHDVGLDLLPHVGDLEPNCDCPGWDHPCQHAAALSYQAAWLLDADPFLLLLMRGRSREEVLDELRVRGRRSPAPQQSGTPAAEAYALEPGALPEVSTDTGATVLDLASVLSRAVNEAVDAAVLDLLARDAAVRACAALAGAAVLPSPDGRRECIRLLAGYPEHPAATAVRKAVGGGTEVDLAVAAWRTDGVAGLEVLQEPWSPPGPVMARARAAVVDLLGDGHAPEVVTWRNRLTVPTSDVQLRCGRNGLWYLYVDRDGEWWPAAPPRPSAGSALLEDQLA